MYLIEVQISPGTKQAHRRRARGTYNSAVSLELLANCALLVEERLGGLGVVVGVHG